MLSTFSWGKSPQDKSPQRQQGQQGANKSFASGASVSMASGRQSVLTSRSMSTNSARPWDLPRPTFLSKAGLPSLSNYIYIPDFGPPPERLPLFLHPFWPTGGVPTNAGGVSMMGGGSTTMSMTDSQSQVSSQIRSGAMSPTRSVVSFSGVSGYGKTGRGQRPPPEEPPFLYGKYNTNAFFGDVAMAFGGDEIPRFRPASVRALGGFSVRVQARSRV